MRLVTDDLEGDEHDDAADDADAQDADHGQVAAAVLVGAGRGVGGPARVERVRGRDAAEVAEPGDEGGRGGDADLAVPLLEDLVGPGHAVGHRGAEPEPDDQQPAVPRPLVRRRGKGDDEQAGDLDQRRAGKEEGAEPVESIGDGGHDEDGDEVHLETLLVFLDLVRAGPRSTYDPDGCKQQAQLNSSKVGVDALDDDGAIQLRADADTNDAKVHQGQGPQSPIDQDVAEVLERPGPGVVDALEVLVVYDGVFAGQGLGRLGQELEDALAHAGLSGRQRAVGQPPEQDESEDYCQQAVDEEHPLESHQTAQAVHLLESGRDEADHGSRDLGGGKVLPDALARPRGRIEEGQVIGHARPHAGNDHTQEESEKSGDVSAYSPFTSCTHIS